jgi:putative IMPACT (imprinted ancient) family translation regulator
MFYYLFYFDIVEVDRSAMNDNCTKHQIKKNSNCEIWGLGDDVSPVGTFEDFKPLNEQNIPEDQYPQSRQYF